MNVKSMILISVGVLVAFIGCTKDVKYRTDHPDHGKLVFHATWPGEAPDSYIVAVGTKEASLSGSEAEFPHLLDEGDYTFIAYNKPAGITVSGLWAALSEKDGYTVSPGWLYSAAGNVSVSKDTDHRVDIAMRHMVRQLNMTVRFDGGSMDKIAINSAELSGAARAIEMATGELTGPVSIAPSFAPVGNEYVATHNLLGVVGASQMLKLNITIPSGTFTVECDISKALVGFNADKTKSLDVELTVSNLEIGRITLDVTGWRDGEIRGGQREEPILGTQIKINWPGVDDKIEVVEMYDPQGRLYTSLVENKSTTGLYALPDEISRMNVICGEILRVATLNILSYDKLTGELIMTDEYNLSRGWHFNQIEDLAGHYIVKNDIDCSGIVVDQIGVYRSEGDNKPFTGILDGGGFEIRNLSLENRDYNGLIAVNAGTVKNLNIAALPTGHIGNQSSTKVIGALCAVNRGTVENCVNRADVQGNMCTGGLVGQNSGTMTGCANYGNITATDQGGGIAGLNNKDAVLSGCTNGGKITGNTKTGGIAGENAGTISSPANDGSVSAMANTGGGIAGANAGTIYKAVNNGGVSGGMNIGGIAGATQTGGNAIVACVNNGTVKGSNSSGGIVGMCASGAVSGCRNCGAVEGGRPLGGIVGTCVASSEVSYCDNSGTVTGSGTQTGGIAGMNTLSKISSCVNLAAGKVKSSAGMVGGIVGDGGTMTSTIENCYNQADVVAGGDRVGGIAGKNAGSITACKNTGEISHGTTKVYCSGIVAETGLKHTLTACYNTGKLVGCSNMGGIIGYHGGNSIAKAVYSTGETDSEHTGRSGAIVGYNLGTSKIYGAYWDVAPRGFGQNDNSNAEQVEIFKFAYDPAEPANTVWPTVEMEGWKVASGENGFAQGYYWSSPGNAATGEHPALWWEPSSGKLLIGADAFVAD